MNMLTDIFMCIKVISKMPVYVYIICIQVHIYLHKMKQKITIERHFSKPHKAKVFMHCSFPKGIPFEWSLGQTQTFGNKKFL